MQRIERFKAKKTRGGGRLWLPRRFVSVIPEETYFEAELVEEGILFRRVTASRNLPDWVNENAG